MNIRQQRYKQNRLSGMSKYASAIKAGYSHNTAINAKVNIENRLSMADLLEMEGLTDKALAEHAVAGLNASDDVSVNGSDIVAGKANWSVRHKYFDTILKLKDKLKGVIVEGKSASTQIIIVRSNGDKEKVPVVQNRVSAHIIQDGE